MRLHIDDSRLHAGRAGSDRVDLAKAATLLGRMGLAIAHGELATPTGARALARQAGLITIETSDARKKGLIQ